MEYNNFKNKLLQDYRDFGVPESTIKKAKYAWDRILNDELPRRDESQSFQIRSLTNSAGLKLHTESDRVVCKYEFREDTLYAGILYPSWRQGWNNFSSDGFINDQIEYFFHFASQYIIRSMSINVIGAIALTFERACDFRYGSLTDYGSYRSNLGYQEFVGSIIKMNSRRNRLFNRYFFLINALDPYVNKAVYYYVNSLSLYLDGYEEESLTSADNAVDTIYQAIKVRKKLPTLPREEMDKIVGKEIALSDYNLRCLKNLYLLRCRFSAHPAQSKWWDFSEIYYKEIDVCIAAARDALCKFLSYERMNPIVESEPLIWSSWFSDNCDMVLDAVWFHLLPELR